MDGGADFNMPAFPWLDDQAHAGFEEKDGKLALKDDARPLDFQLQSLERVPDPAQHRR